MDQILDGLIDADELREQVIERAAEKVIAHWRPPADDEGRQRFDQTLQGRVDEMVKTEVLAVMQGPVALAIDNALEGEFQPTDPYGNPRSGPKRTLREMIALRVEEQVKLPDNRPGYSSNGRDTALSEWLTREIRERVKKQLWTDFQAIADAVSESAASAIQDNLKYLLKARVKR
jgi:hypothetical protein